MRAHTARTPRRRSGSGRGAAQDCSTPASIALPPKAAQNESRVAWSHNSTQVGTSNHKLDRRRVQRPAKSGGSRDRARRCSTTPARGEEPVRAVVLGEETRYRGESRTHVAIHRRYPYEKHPKHIQPHTRPSSKPGEQGAMGALRERNCCCASFAETSFEFVL